MVFFQKKASLNSKQTSIIAKLECVGLRYGHQNEETLHDIDLMLEKGSFQFLVGSSGAGKTSLLKILYLALTPTRGNINLFGNHLGDLNRKQKILVRRKIGIVFQDFRLLNHLDVFENVALPLRVRGEKRSDYKNDIEELLYWVGLGKYLHASPATLSGGEQQRVAIARAIVAKPALLIADEPTGNVDSEIGNRLMRLFMELNKLGTTILIATHDLTLAQKSKANILALKSGYLKAYSSVQDYLEDLDSNNIDEESDV